MPVTDVIIDEITATVRTVSASGSRWPSFFSRTRLSVARRCANARDSAVTRACPGTAAFSANSPRRNFNRRIFRTASSMFRIGTSPLAISDFR